MKNNKLLYFVATLIFLVFLGFWLWLGARNLRGDTHAAEVFSALYGVMAFFGGLVGLKISKKWGGFKSLIGRAVMFMSLGLLAQEAGQITYSMYTYLWHQEIPYPSLGDIGYFSSVILYLLAAYNLIRAVNVKTALKRHTNKLSALLVPGALLTVSYLLLLKGYEFSTEDPLRLFLDLGYPFGQAIYISLGILAFLLSRRYLGGIMRPVITFLLAALLLQYLADFTFLYQTGQDTWETGGSNELLYLSAYYVMTLSLIKFGAVFNRLSASGKKG